MIGDIQTRMAKANNELKALKVYSGLSYSSLLLPENIPEQTYSGTASLGGSSWDMVARLRFRFTRTDGLIDPPLINFTLNASVTPDYKSYAESYGFVFYSGNVSYIANSYITGYINELGDGYVDYYVDFAGPLNGLFYYLDDIDFSVTVQALANVRGTLSVERLI